GGAVAQEVARIRAAAQERARQAELERAEALVRETEQRKRRRVWFSLAATFLVGLIASAALAIQASRERQRAEQAATAEKQANEQAQKRLSQIEKGNELIASIFTDLDLREIKQGTEPLEAVLAQRLVKAAEQLEAESVGDPLAVAQLQDRLGRSLLHLGHPQPAIGLFEKARTTRT